MQHRFQNKKGRTKGDGPIEIGLWDGGARLRAPFCTRQSWCNPFDRQVWRVSESRPEVRCQLNGPNLRALLRRATPTLVPFRSKCSITL
ncbi:unnamed protein product [Microthlaspi erraticum]|uniref:Uncharacterized protein n=1 Tax=Microthlaspi erraticum TaxID=1685480 RepID=A0A6D2K5M5_9BRAS|nr:unnamed protein product [Microthlaspi erraticum]